MRVNMSTPHVGSVGFRFCLRSFRHHWKLFGCMFEIDIPRKLEVIPVRDVRRFLVESCGLTKIERRRQRGVRERGPAAGLPLGPRSRAGALQQPLLYSNYGLPLAIYYLLPAPYNLLPTTGVPAPPTASLADRRASRLGLLTVNVGRPFVWLVHIPKQFLP